MADEKVLCLKRKVLEDAEIFQGLSRKVNRFLKLLDDEKNIFFLPKPKAEQNFEFKQWIPYVFIQKGKEILRYQRSQKGGETRLRGMYSIGIGGHVTDEDWAQGKGYLTGLMREVVEETGLQSKPGPAVGAINDDSTEVGRVHFGIVHIIKLPENAKINRGEEISSPEFISISKAYKNRNCYETWSRICLEYLMPELLTQTKPQHRR